MDFIRSNILVYYKSELNGETGHVSTYTELFLKSWLYGFNT